MKIIIQNTVRAAISMLLLLPFVLNGQSVKPENGISRTYKCGVKNSSKFKIAADDNFIFYLQDERQSKTNLYKINTLTGFIDSFSFTPNNSTDLSFYELTAMDVSNDTLVICYGNNIYIYSLTQENKCLFCKRITLPSGNVVFSASLYLGKLYLSCDIPNEIQKHIFRIIDCNSGEEVSSLNHFTHLATLTTFKPSSYFSTVKDTIFYYDSENFQILTVYKNKIDTFINVKYYFKSNINDFIKATTKIKDFKELDHYIMNLFGKFSFDFIHEIYITNSKIYLYYFPANYGSYAKLERQLCVIDRGSLNKTDYVITRTTEHNLLDFKSVVVGDELYIVSNNDNALHIKEYSKLIKK